MIEIVDTSKCCGCTACEAICPTHAIEMTPNIMGFKYPKVDLNKCIDCHLCEKVCQFHPDYDTQTNFDQPLAFGVRHKDLNEVTTSRSGAAFIALSDTILEEGGVIYGSVVKDDLTVAHIRATSRIDRDLMKGSKYVQSDLTGIFKQIKEDLKAGSTVLYSGTPCQTSGLKSYIGPKLAERLYLIDIVCHGVPSPAIWRDYVNWLKNKWQTDIEVVNFRDKHFGWRAHKESYITKKGIKYCNSFTRAFYKHIILRDSCQVCPFTNTARPSDLTLADFWGWEKNDNNWNKDDMGLSLVLINTQKGKTLFEKSLKYVDAKEFPLENCMQNQMRHPIKFNPSYLEFRTIYSQSGFETAMRKFECIGLKYNVYHTLSDIKQTLKKYTRK